MTALWAEAPSVSKTAVVSLFIAGVVIVVAGSVFWLVAVLLAIAGGAVTLGGPAFFTVNGPAFAGTVGWLAVASLVVGAGSVIAVLSWIGALLNTVRLEDRTWFIALLVLGLLSFGWLAMIVYVFAGPDGTKNSRRATT